MASGSDGPVGSDGDPRLLVVSGPPGAGKSTVARLLAEGADPSVLVEGDAFFAFLATGAVEPWREGSERQNQTVIAAGATAAATYARGGYDVVYDGVVGPWFLPTFLGATGLPSVDYVLLLPSADGCVDRVRSRVGHAFADEEATRGMHAHFAAAATAVAPGHVVDSTRLTPEMTAKVVAGARATGRLRYRGPAEDPGL